jgi:hypothetical protein
MSLESVVNNPWSGAFFQREVMDDSQDVKSLGNEAHNRLIQNNILKDKFYPFQIHLHGALCVDCNYPFVGFAKQDRIVLYDLVARQMLWECSVDFKIYQVNNLRVSPDGVVVLSTINNSPYDVHPIYHIYFEGKKTGVIDEKSIPFDKYFKVVNGEMYALAWEKESSSIFVWDRTGKKVNEIALNSFSDGEKQVPIFNRDFYVMTAGTCHPKVPARVFIWNLISQKSVMMDLGCSNDEVEIKPVFIHGSFLICGIHYHQKFRSYLKDREIVVIDLLTNTVTVDYKLQCQLGKILEIVANDAYIIFCVGDANNSIWSINRHTGKQQKVIELQHMDVHNRNPNLSLFGDLLHICQPSNLIQNQGFFLYTVVHLPTSAIVKVVSYQRNSGETMSFQDGKLFFIDSDTGNCRIWVEDFVETTGDDNQKYVNPTRHSIEQIV